MKQMIYDGYPIYGISILQTENEDYFRGYVLSSEKDSVFVTEFQDTPQEVLEYIWKDISFLDEE